MMANHANWVLFQPTISILSVMRGLRKEERLVNVHLLSSHLHMIWANSFSCKLLGSSTQNLRKKFMKRKWRRTTCKPRLRFGLNIIIWHHDFGWPALISSLIPSLFFFSPFFSGNAGSRDQKVEKEIGFQSNTDAKLLSGTCTSEDGTEEGNLILIEHFRSQYL